MKRSFPFIGLMPRATKRVRPCEHNERHSEQRSEPINATLHEALASQRRRIEVLEMYVNEQRKVNDMLRSQLAKLYEMQWAYLSGQGQVNDIRVH